MCKSDLDWSLTLHPLVWSCYVCEIQLGSFVSAVFHFGYNTPFFFLFLEYNTFESYTKVRTTQESTSQGNYVKTLPMSHGLGLYSSADLICTHFYYNYRNISLNLYPTTLKRSGFPLLQGLATWLKSHRFFGGNYYCMLLPWFCRVFPHWDAAMFSTSLPWVWGLLRAGNWAGDCSFLLGHWPQLSAQLLLISLYSIY